MVPHGQALAPSADPAHVDLEELAELGKANSRMARRAVRENKNENEPGAKDPNPNPIRADGVRM